MCTRAKRARGIIQPLSAKVEDLSAYVCVCLRLISKKAFLFVFLLLDALLQVGKRFVEA